VLEAVGRGAAGVETAVGRADGELGELLTAVGRAGDELGELIGDDFGLELVDEL
jgi:hypothetical protein